MKDLERIWPRIRGVDDQEPLIRLLDEGRLGQSYESRERERLLQQLAEDDASFTGTLLDLAERQSMVTVRTDSGRTHHGAILTVGADFLVVGAADQQVFLRTDAVASVRPHRGERHVAARGERPPALDLFLIEALARSTPERPRVVLVTRASEIVAGILVATGTDVVTVRVDGEARSLCYVPIRGIVEATVDCS